MKNIDIEIADFNLVEWNDRLRAEVAVRKDTENFYRSQFDDLKLDFKLNKYNEEFENKFVNTVESDR